MIKLNMHAEILNKFLSAALITGCIFLYSCENDPGKVNSLRAKALNVEEGKDVVLNYTIGGKIKTILKAPVMLRVQDTVVYVEFPKTLVADFFNDKGIAESKLTAHYGKYKENENIVYLKDSVKVINFQKGDTLYCDELYWDRSRTGAEFYTDKAVRIRTRTQVLDGIGMEARQDFKEYSIMKPTGNILVPASKLPGN